MENKQSAVEWSIEQLQAPCRGIPSHIIEQAKQMELAQRIDDYTNGHIDREKNLFRYAQFHLGRV